jgi:23S rRNA (guanosine2251-2'-O)-methyltransferase
MKTSVLILDNIRSVENVGSIFRTGEGLGVKKIICIGTTPTPLDRFGRKRNDFAKVSLGAENIDWSYEKDLGFTIQDLRDQGFKIISLEQTPEAKKLGSFEANKLGNFALVVRDPDGVDRPVWAALHDG